MPEIVRQHREATPAMKWMPLASAIVAWGWTILAAGGGVMLLIERGPWPLTNGWYALASGIAACPLTAQLIRRTFRIPVSGWARFAAAVLFWLAGQVARRVG